MRRLLKKLLFLCLVFNFAHINYASNVDLIVFSFNRPLQLYAFLESVYKYTSVPDSIYVLYRSSNYAYESAYKELKESFGNVCFVKQGNNPRKDFKPLLLKCFNESSSEYVVFGVDDIIIKDYFDFNACISFLEQVDAYGFYLRLGKNITRAYNVHASFALPPLKSISDDVYLFRFDEGQYDWAYPNTVDMTIYKKSKIKDFLSQASYSSPNTLEGTWASKADKGDIGICFGFSKIFNILLNIVQQDWHNPNENSFNAKQLLDKWNQGLKIDIDCFFKIDNESPHIKAIPTFTKRKDIV